MTKPFNQYLSTKPLTIINQYAFFYTEFPSNWHYSPFIIDNQSYACVEQYMMAEKARLFNDPSTLNQILNAQDPKTTKDLGRQVKNYDDNIWTNQREEIVLKGTIEKYKQNPHLLKRLLETNNLILVEASIYDKIWGIGKSLNDPTILNTQQWGQNLLGKVLNQAKLILST